MYETPIRIIMADTEHVLEDEIYRAIQKYAVDVNKEELLKALQYDRDQYNKGYQDGLNADKWISCSERLPTEQEAWYRNDEEGVYEPNEFIVQVKGAELPTVAVFDGKEFTSKYADDDYGFLYEIIAWQPLPKPYKGEQE